MTTIAQRVENAEQQVTTLAQRWIQQVAGVGLSEDELAEVGKLKALFDYDADPALFAAVLADLRLAVISHDEAEKMGQATKVQAVYSNAGLDRERHNAAWLEIMGQVDPAEVHTIDDLLRLDRAIYERMRATDHE